MMFQLEVPTHLRRVSELPAFALTDEIKVILVEWKLRGVGTELREYIILIKSRYPEVYSVFKEWRQHFEPFGEPQVEKQRDINGKFKYTTSKARLQSTEETHIILYLLSKYFNHLKLSENEKSNRTGNAGEPNDNPVVSTEI